MYQVLSLFTGSGALCCDAIANAGLKEMFKVIQFVEKDPYRIAVLKRRYQNIDCQEDVRTFKGKRGTFDAIVGGSPCQDISRANPSRNGLTGDKSGLWWEMFRIITESQPRWVIWENVAAARYPTPGDTYSPLAYVIGSLTSIGYLCEWITISAADVGAPHKRERILLVATYTNGTQSSENILQSSWARQVRTEIAKAWDCATRGDQYARISRMDAGSTTWLDSYNLGGWWQENPPPENISAPSRSIPNRGKRVQLIGDCCTPAQGAIAWRRVASLAQGLEVQLGQRQ